MELKSMTSCVISFIRSSDRLINRSIHKIQEGLHHLKDLGGTFQPVRRSKKGLGDRMKTRIVLATDVLRIREILRETLGDCFHMRLADDGKQRVERLRPDDGMKFLGLLTDTLTHGTQHV